MKQHFPFTNEEYAERFGLASRNVFRRDSWDECKGSLRKSWEALSGIRSGWQIKEMSWEDALPLIHKAWESETATC